MTSAMTREQLGVTHLRDAFELLFLLLSLTECFVTTLDLVAVLNLGPSGRIFDAWVMRDTDIGSGDVGLGDLRRAR